ncbi:MAG: branched-chain amino acid transport system ATP-binding protein, partial [Hyphomicrobiales bacterium]|nr:branched-chain amino acid transport system ATP-binding protein [Hyphomicrobiales bacterium]
MAPILQLDDLTRRFGGVTAVDALSLSVNEGELVSIIGPNGAGKTTVFNIVTGLLAPDAGRVMLSGSDITGLPA